MENGSSNLVQREIRTLYAVGTFGGMTDGQLLELFVSRPGGDAEAAFTALVERHGTLVLSVCRRTLPPHDAEDAFQATFLVLARRAASIGRRDRLASWLYGVALRTAKEARRRTLRQVAREGRLMSAAKAQPAPGDEPPDWLPLLDEELSRLPERYRAALVTCELEGKSRREAAAELGVPEGTLSTHLARGRKLLRERLERRGVNLGASSVASVRRPPGEAAVAERLAASTVRAAVGYAGGNLAGAVPASVEALADRVLKIMVLARISVIVPALAALGLAAVLAAAATSSQPELPPTVVVRAEPPAKRPAKEPRAVDRGARVQGIVVDEAGAPLAGMELRVSSVGDRETRGVTNAAGRFDFLIRTAELANVVVLAANADRSRQAIYQYSVLLSAEEAKRPVRIVCTPVREVETRVLARDGRPVGDAHVAFLTERTPVADGRTGADGRWTVRVPANAKMWCLHARKAALGFEYAVAGPGGPSGALKPLPDQVTLILNGARTARLKAVNRHGEPIAGARIGISAVQRPGHDWFNSCFVYDPASWPATGADGLALLDWLPEDCVTGVVLEGQAEGHYALAPAWIPRDPVPPEPLTLTFLPLETLSGRVTHADGRPAAGIVVSAAGVGPVTRRGGGNWHGSALTGADGRYEIGAFSEHVYVVDANSKAFAAPCRTDVVLRAGKPVGGIDFVLGKSTRVHGRATIGAEGAPVVRSSVRVYAGRDVVRGRAPIEGVPNAPWVELKERVFTDKHGEYEVYLGPGRYRIVRRDPKDAAAVEIPAVNPPAEIRRDITQAPDPPTRAIRIRVVDAAGQPVAGAVVNGIYASHDDIRHRFASQTTDEQGTVQTSRAPAPLVLHAMSSDRTLAGVLRVDAESSDCRIVVGPVATASGRFLDQDGRALAGKLLQCGLRVAAEDQPSFTVFSVQIGGMTRSDAQGRFRLPHLIPGQSYEVQIELSDTARRNALSLTPQAPGPFDAGDKLVRMAPVNP